MAKQLSTKVEHCPKCRKLKSKVGPCKSCGYEEPKKHKHLEKKPIAESVKSYSIPSFDAKTSAAIIVNGVKFERK